MVFNLLNDFCYDGGKVEYISVNSYAARWNKNIKDSVIRLNKKQMIDAVAYLLFNCCFTIGSKIFCQITGISMGSDPAFFLPTIYLYLYLYFYESKWINELKKDD